MAKIVKLIETEITKGKGTKEDPYRLVVQYWTRKGNLLFEIDTWGETDNICSQAD